MSKIKGNRAEDLASAYYTSLGYELLERNYRYGRAEIDLIVLLSNRLLVFVEVKMRSGSNYGEPETFVSENQRRKILEAADDYIHAIHWDKDIRFDILTIDANDSIELFEDAF